MKFDMHCHTNEGSMDGKVPIEEYISKLESLGFGGMLTADHNTYNGYREWKNTIKGQRHSEFVVLKGIEYDTIDAGHILIIMPYNTKLRILELRGLPVGILIEVVHHFGGVLGPAHPCGERYLSITNTKKKRSKTEWITKFDFIEAFNACESPESNEAAQQIARKYHKPGFGGSDAHKIECVGKAYTEFPDTVKTETDLIAYLHTNPTLSYGGSRYNHTTKNKLGKLNAILVQGFFLYNKAGGLLRSHRRHLELKKII